MQTDKQGQKAASNGATFEKIIEDYICGALDIPSTKYDPDHSVHDQILWKNAPYESIYGTRCRSEFLLQLGERKIRIECKYQSVAGSVDEKLPYLMMNFTQQVPEDETIIIIDGDGWRPGAVQWLRTACEGTKCKVFSSVEFLFYVATEFVDADSKQEQTQG
jgi:hypothetical protein